MPTYLHECNKCEHEWEAFYSIKADPPTLCPSCEEEGGVKRLVSGGSGRGIVILTGHERKAKINSDAKKFRETLGTDENARANFIGESTYHQQQLRKESLTNDLVKIGKNTAKTKGVVRRST